MRRFRCGLKGAQGARVCGVRVCGSGKAAALVATARDKRHGRRGGGARHELGGGRERKGEGVERVCEAVVVLIECSG
jgi:hypothetical protein